MRNQLYDMAGVTQPYICAPFLSLSLSIYISNNKETINFISNFTCFFFFENQASLTRLKKIISLLQCQIQRIDNYP